jgi:hypothetical protein
MIQAILYNGRRERALVEDEKESDYEYDNGYELPDDNGGCIIERDSHDWGSSK